MKEFVSGASVRLAELEDLFVDMKARVRLFPKSNTLFKHENIETDFYYLAKTIPISFAV